MQQHSIFVTDTIQMQYLREEEAESLFQLVDAHRAYLRQFLGWVDYNVSVEDSRLFIEQEIDKQVRLEGFTLGIYEEGSLLGLLSVYAIDQLNHNASIGYWIAEDSQGKGIMTQCVQKIIEHCFQKMKLHRLEIRCAVHNLKSQQIPKRLGFHEEGILKEAISHYGQYFDAYLYAFLHKGV